MSFIENLILEQGADSQQNEIRRFEGHVYEMDIQEIMKIEVLRCLGKVMGLLITQRLVKV